MAEARKGLRFVTEYKRTDSNPGAVTIILDDVIIGRIWVAFFDSEISSWKKWFKPQIVHGLNGKSAETNLKNAKKHVREYLKELGRIPHR